MLVLVLVLVLGFRTSDFESFGRCLNSHIICRHSVVVLGLRVRV